MDQHHAHGASCHQFLMKVMNQSITAFILYGGQVNINAIKIKNLTKTHTIKPEKKHKLWELIKKKKLQRPYQRTWV